MSSVVRLRSNVGVPLSNATLQLHCRTVRVPNYDRSALRPSVVHIGVGGFHRAHQAAYFDDLASLGVSRQCGIVGVSLRHRRTKDILSEQDSLYTLVQRSGQEDTARVIGSLQGCLYAGEDPAAVVTALTDDRTRIVSLTITGNGYYLDPNSGQFDTEADDVRADLRSRTDFTTAWAYLAAALDRRRRAGKPPFTVLSCDNLPDSGKATRTALVSFAAARDESLARWIDRHVSFPSSMVDRITPQTGPAERELVERSFGIADRLPVVAEQFGQWVIEDTFCNGRPALEEAGVEFVTDVSGHKLVKTRLLNGTHSALGYLGTLAGYERMHEAMDDPVIYSYAEQLMRSEIAPLLPAVPGLDIQAYCTTVLERFCNPRISDQLSRLAARGSAKIPSYLLPSLHEAIRSGRPHTLLTLAVAGWFRYLRGYDLSGAKIHVQDPQARLLTTLATMGKSNPGPLLRLEPFDDLRMVPHFPQQLGELLQSIDARGVTAAMRRHLWSDTRELMRR
ncbi:mannitol dehydrogenase [Mycobacterium asiaticum DSM 44297]|uniref:mannitol dehydrogenase family protein n=1 Tax=Mycobacterium asiaticum TaxID=1790 RepID=UPI00068631E2|nr:mannitol dehydrogenase family protein [Mycobacterium asiaticum]ORA08768.1 mannitol dehydrogenase [Mycobacterium asiaticum DSM 44297]